MNRSAYLYIPFCVHRCGYCNFTVITGRDNLVEPLLAAISTELSWLGSPCPVETLYFGGGTPTYLSPNHFHEICKHAAKLPTPTEWTKSPLDTFSGGMN